MLVRSFADNSVNFEILFSSKVPMIMPERVPREIHPRGLLTTWFPYPISCECCFKIRVAKFRFHSLLVILEDLFRGKMWNFLRKWMNNREFVSYRASQITKTNTNARFRYCVNFSVNAERDWINLARKMGKLTRFLNEGKNLCRGKLNCWAQI